MMRIIAMLVLVLDLVVGFGCAPQDQAVDGVVVSPADGAEAMKDAGGVDVPPGADDALSHSGQRLRFVAATGVDGSSLRLNLWDTELEMSCYPRIAADGVPRCLPAVFASEGDISFSDAECVSPVVFAFEPPCGSMISIGTTEVGPAPPFCTAALLGNGRVNGYRVEGLVPDGAQLFRTQSDGSCVPSIVATQLRHYIITGPLPASTFVEFAIQLSQ
jgi:hypothetical protein